MNYLMQISKNALLVSPFHATYRLLFASIPY